MATTAAAWPVTAPTIVDLARLRATDIVPAGGKAANLGELIAAGFPVPDGFCVTTAAYARVAAAAGVDGGTAEQARGALLAAPVPDDVVGAIRRAYLGLGGGAVAVRSSATAEDLPTASFAGQQDSFLNVVGADAVLEAVRRCWASLWTERAVRYRAEAGVDDATVQLAVVVQRMVDAGVAGVLFTADPVTGRRGTAVIDANPGLGEAVVSGAVNPEHVVVAPDGTLVEHRAGDGRLRVRPRPGGGTDHLALHGATGLSLTENAARTLAALGRQVEEHFGAPQDIEWAIDRGGRQWLTQARPITTLYPLPPVTPDPRAYFCVSLAQGLTRPITPMGVSAFRVVGSVPAADMFGAHVRDPLDGPPALVAIGGRAFVDVTPALHSRVGRALAPAVLDLMEARSATVLRRLSEEPAFAVRTTSRWPFVRRVLRVALHYRIPPLVALALARPAAARRRVDRVGARLQTLAACPAGVASPERLDHVERILLAIFPVLPTVVPVAGAGLAMLALARRLTDDDLDTDEVLRSLPHNPTMLMDLELWELAVRIRAESHAAALLARMPPADLAVAFRAGTLPTVAQDGLSAFLARHGHRAAAEIDIGVPRWSDDPTPVLAVLAGYLRLEDAGRAPDVQFARGAAAAEAAVTRAVARARRRSVARSAVVRFALRRTRQLVGLRETHKDYLVRLLAYARAELRLVGVELTGRGLLADPGDVFFLDLREVRRATGGADLRPTVTARRADHDRELRRRHVPRILLSDGTEPEALASGSASGDAVLVGSPASAGTVTGAARVVLDPATARLEPGEILVAPSTDPGWTPLFLTAGGLVMEMGGPGSHGAVVAREYGIPAVVGVPAATTLIATGQQVTVDGAAGLVRLH